MQCIKQIVQYHFWRPQLNQENNTEAVWNSDFFFFFLSFCDFLRENSTGRWFSLIIGIGVAFYLFLLWVGWSHSPAVLHSLQKDTEYLTVKDL